MKQSILCILFVLMGMSASAADFPDVAGWKPEGGAKIYDSESLWEYINGAAELFLAYGFQELRVRDLGSGELVMTVSIYDLTGRLVWHDEQTNVTEIVWDGGGLANGAYIYVIRAADGINSYGAKGKVFIDR